MRGERGIIRRVLKDGTSVYYVDYRDAAGKRHQERVGTNRRLALRARDARLAAVAAGRFGLRSAKGTTLREFVDETWRPQVMAHRKPSTQRGYEWMLAHHLLPHFGGWKLVGITRPAIKAFIAAKGLEQHQSRNRTKPENPDRAVLSPKTIVNMVALLGAILESAAVDYELIPGNPARGMLRRSNFPAQLRPKDRRPAVLEPEDFRRAVEAIPDWRPRRMVLFAALTGLRWGEQVAVRVDEDVDFRAGKIRITRSFYRRTPQTPKTEQSVRDVDLSPLVRKILKTVPWTEGLIFSPDGTRRIGEGSWLKRAWRKAQLSAGIKRPIHWHHLRHQFVSLLIAGGKNPLYIAEQAGHSDPGFTLRRYGHLFKTIKPSPAEWPEDLLWPAGASHPGVTVVAADDTGASDEVHQGSPTNIGKME